MADPLGSNHLPILIQSNKDSQQHRSTTTTRKWNIKRADWADYALKMDQYTRKQLTSLHPFSYENFINSINKACDSAIPKYKVISNNKPTHHAKCWWTRECSEAVTKRKSSFTLYKSHSTPDNYIKYLQASAQAKLIIKQSKKKSWQNYCESINRHTNITDIWNKFKQLKNRKTSCKQPVVVGSWTEDFLDTLCPPSVNQEFTFPTSDSMHHILTAPFTNKELSNAIKRNTNTAPGHDQIHYPMLHHLPPSAKSLLLSIFNEIWVSGSFPSEWKNYIIIPLLKPSKPDNNASSYRPIALASCVLKTYERLIKGRLEWFLEHNNLLPNTQFGFRKGRSIYDCHTTLITDIETAFTSNKNTFALFIDISRAYDSVDLNILGHKMLQLGLPGKLVKNLIHLISDRKISIRVGNELIGPKVSSVGVPQGGILSCLLYAIYVYDIEQVIPAEGHLIQFADDVCLYTICNTIDEGKERMHGILSSVVTWATSNGLNISPTKSSICVFSKRRRLNIGPSMTLAGFDFPCEESVRFLGILLERKLKWTKHINLITHKAEQYVNILKMISNSRWGAEPSTCLLFYRSTIRAIIDFGSIFYGQASKTVLRQLDVLQNKCIRLCINYLNSTPVDAMLVEVNEPPLYLRRRMLTDRYVFKCHSIAPSVSRRIVHLTTLVLSRSYWRTKAPPPIINSFVNTVSTQTSLFQADQIPLFKYDYTLFQRSIPVHYMPDYKNVPPDLVNYLFADDMANRFPGFYAIYSDGSKLNGLTGAAIYDPVTAYSKMFQLSPLVSTYYAESVAILEALKYCDSLTADNVVIVTDCQSFLVQLQHFQPINLSPLTLDIINMWSKLKTRSMNVHFLWVRGHSGIHGNEQADDLAKRAVIEGEVTNYHLYYTDCYSSLYQDLKEKWQVLYSAGHVGLFYKNINPMVGGKPWFHQGNLPRRCVMVLCRLRANHGLCGKYLHMIGVQTTNLCHLCNERDDLEHIVMRCRKYAAQRESLCSALTTKKVTFTYANILREVYDLNPELYKFVTDSKLTI